MSDDLSWVKWWAFPWKNAHIDWLTQTGFVEAAALSRSHHRRVSDLFGIEPGLPPAASSALLQLVLSSTQQRDLVLILINEVYKAPHDERLNQEQLLWCQRLAKALPPGPASTNIDDPLQYLRAWVLIPTLSHHAELSPAEQPYAGANARPDDELWRVGNGSDIDPQGSGFCGQNPRRGRCAQQRRAYL